MLEYAHITLFNDTCDQGAMEEEAKLFYKMMDSAKIPLHDNTTVSQLDAIGRLLGVKSELNISRAGFNRLLIVVGSFLPKGHSLPTSMYESTTLFEALRIEGPIRRTRGGGSEWEPIKILLEGDGGSNKMNMASNTRLRLTTQVGQAHPVTECYWT
jgi:hypothetical protein